MICRVRLAAPRTGPWLALYAVLASASVARRNPRVCGTCSAVAINCVTKIEFGDHRKPGPCDHCVEGITGTSATQAGCASKATPSSIVGSGRSMLDIGSHDLGLNCRILGHS